MKKYQPDRHGLISVRILTTLFSVILSIISNIYVISEFLLFIVIIFIVTISIFVMFVYFPLYFSSLAYETTSTEVMSTISSVTSRKQSRNIRWR